MSQSMTNALGRNVIALDTAEDIGEVKSFVVDQTASSVERIHIAGRKKNALFAEWSALESFGDDAVMVRAAEEPSASEDDRDIDVAKGAIDIIGSRVLDTAGFEAGTVTDVEFDDASGAIISVATSEDATVAADWVVSLGSYALVVRH